jgi:hypothetical protein
MYKEIDLYDIKNHPTKVNYILTDNANHFANDLYILFDGNHFQFDSVTLQSLKDLSNKIEKILDKLN